MRHYSTETGATIFDPAGPTTLNCSSTGDFVEASAGGDGFTQDLGCIYTGQSTGRLGVGNVDPSTALHVTAAPIAPSTSVTAFSSMVSIMSDSGMATGAGGSLALGGCNVTDCSSVAAYAKLFGVKENGTSGNSSGRLDFYTALGGTGSRLQASLSSAGAWTWPSYTTSGLLANSSSGVVFTTRTPLIPVLTLAAQPTCDTASKGRIGTVSNGTAGLAWGATVTSSGSTYYVITCNGANWTVMGQ